MRIRWTSQAYNDITEAIEFIVKDNFDAANALAEKIWRSVQNLSRHPSMGRLGRVSGTRELTISGTTYLAVYRIEKDSVSILRILHVARKWPEDL